SDRGRGEVAAVASAQRRVGNKIDRIEGALARRDIPEPSHGNGEDALPGGTVAVGRERVWISARDGLGLDLLQDALSARLAQRRIVAELALPPEAGRLRARLHQLDAVRGESQDEHGWRLQVDLSEADAARLAAHADGAVLRPLLPELEPDPTL